MGSIRVAKEEQQKTRQQQERHACEGTREQPRKGSDNRGAQDEGPTGRVDSHRLLSGLGADSVVCPAPAERKGCPKKQKPGLVSDAVRGKLNPVSGVEVQEAR